MPQFYLPPELCGVDGDCVLPVIVPMAILGLREKGRLQVALVIIGPELLVAGMLPDTACVSMSADEVEKEIGGRGNREEAGGRREVLSVGASVFTGVACAASCCCCCNCWISWR